MRRIEQLVDVPKLVLRIWAMLWIVLIILVIFKLCFNIWYPIVVDSSWFTRVCAVVEDTKLVRNVIIGVFYMLSANIIFLTSIRSMKYSSKKSFIIFNCLFLTTDIIKYFNNTLGAIIELSFLIVIPIIINLKHKRCKNKLLCVLLPILVYIAFNLWQLNMLFIRNINEILSSAHILIFLVIQLDYYIFLIITWIGVNYFMGFGSVGWFFGKSDTELKAMKKAEYKRDEPNFDLIREIDEELQRRQDAKKETI